MASSEPSTTCVQNSDEDQDEHATEGGQTQAQRAVSKINGEPTMETTVPLEQEATPGEDLSTSAREEKSLIQSVSEIISESAYSVKAIVSRTSSDSTIDENGVEKSMMQSVGLIITHSAQSVKEAVISNLHGTHAENGEEKSILQSMGAIIAQSAQSVKGAIDGSSPQNFRTEPDETGEASILLHSIVHD